MASQYTHRICDKKPGFDFVAAHFHCEENPYSAATPEGYVNLGSAQNFLNQSEINDRVDSVAFGSSDTKYQSFVGTEACRRAIAKYLQSVSGAKVGFEQVLVGNGAISLLEALAIALLDPEDAVLIPAPVFPGLVNAFRVRQSRSVVLMETDATTGFRLTAAALRNELSLHADNGTPLKAVLLCSPGNPVGQVFSAAEIEDFVQITAEYNVALIVDEIYASSCFGPAQFFSAISTQAEHVFVLGGLSKDFGVAGFATAWLYGLNQPVMRAVASQSHFFRVPAPVLSLVESLLEPEWSEQFLRTSRERLQTAFQFSVDELTRMDVPVFESEAGLCLWLDLRDYLATVDAAGEQELYELLLNKHRVHVSPGSGFHCADHGFFRICFAQKPNVLAEGLERIASGLSEARQRNTIASQPISI